MAAATSYLAHLIAPRSHRAEPLSTGVLELDRVLGGIPQASLTEIFGEQSSGRTSLVQSILRAALAAGLYGVWIDTSDAFDPQAAAGAGISLSQLLWVRCRQKPEHALKAADLLVRAGGFSLLVLDLSGQSPRVLNRIPMATWFRLRTAAEQSGTTLIVTSETSNAGSCARLKLATMRNHISWSQNLLRGTSGVVLSPRRDLLQPIPFATAV